MEPNFSIIIPHHETPRLLSRLLSSVPWSLQPEVIVVDDASGAEALAEVEKLHDEFDFQLYCIDRHTAGAARNEGLRHACGRWLIFADADDYFTADAARLWQKHVDDTADLVFFDVTSVNGSPAFSAAAPSSARRSADVFANWHRAPSDEARNASASSAPIT